MAAPRLYSYCIPFDNGSAPNPYGGVCTLVICKPGIRFRAQPEFLGNVAVEPGR